MKRSLQKGFTLIEMLVVAPIVILAIGAFLTVIISLTGEVLSSRGSNALAYNIQDALNRIEQDVKLSTTFLAQNNITPLANGQGYSGANLNTNFENVGTASGGPTLILNGLVTNDNPVRATAGFVYLANQPNACTSPAVVDNKPMSMNIVYFVKDNALWRRTIMPSNYQTAAERCSTPWQQPSCAPGYSAGWTFCKTNDIKLVEGSSLNLAIDYFTAASSTIPNTVASDTGADVTTRNTALLSTPTVGVTVTANQTVAGRDISRTATLRTSRLDTNASAIAATPTQSSLSTPAAPVATGITSSRVDLTWTAPAGVPTHYTLQYSPRSDFSSSVTTVNNITTTSRSVTGLSTGRVYFFRISATNSTGTTAYSPATMGTPPGTVNWNVYTKITGVSDWNKDGKNDIVGYRSNGDIELRLGKGDGSFGGIIALGNIGTTVRNLIGPGTLPSGTAPILWWCDTAGQGFFLTSDGEQGVVSGTATASGTGWNSYTSVFAAPRWYNNGTVAIISKVSALTMWSLNSAGTPSNIGTWGSGWDAAFPGDFVFGAGDMGSDGLGDIVGVNTSSGAMSIYTGLGNGTGNSGVSMSSGWTSNSIVTGGWDYTSDNRPDILRYHTSTSPYLMIYTGTGSNGVNAGTYISNSIN